eukprot:1146402-Pelagomonas_calceolata.AAC.2
MVAKSAPALFFSFAHVAWLQHQRLHLCFKPLLCTCFKLAWILDFLGSNINAYPPLAHLAWQQHQRLPPSCAPCMAATSAPNPLLRTLHGSDISACTTWLTAGVTLLAK